MEDKTQKSKNDFEELLAITRSDAELRAQFVTVLENLKAEHSEIQEIIEEFRTELGEHGREMRTRLERMERVIDATYLHVSHLAESAIAILRSDRVALDELRAEIEKKALDRLDKSNMTIEAGKDVTIHGDVSEGEGK